MIDNKLTVHVLGLGESLDDFEHDGSMTVGVNDIQSRFMTDFVVCVDHPKIFPFDRLRTILHSKCKGFYSQINEWNEIPNFQKIEFNPGRGIVDGLDSDRFCYSISSPYVAAVLAYKLGAKKIVLWGVDFRTHPNFVDHKRERALRDFRELNQAFKQRGVEMFVGSDWSELSRFLPIWTDKNSDHQLS